MTEYNQENKTYAGKSFEDVLRQLADTINRACLLHCGNREDANDCFQNTFLKLYLTDKEFESMEHIKAWLLTVALHECMDVYRQKWKRKISLSDDIGSVMLQKEGFLQEDEKTEDETLKIVLSLPLKYRRVIYLYYYEEYSVAEIAAILSLSENTIKTQLSRGRDKINQKINQSGNKLYRTYLI